MKQEIITWLSGPRVYSEGVALYEKHGVNKHLKNSFARSNSQLMQQALVYELGKLAGLTETQVQALPRKSQMEPVKKNTIPVQERTPESNTNSLENALMELGEQLNCAVDDIFNLRTDLDQMSDEVKEAISKLKPRYDEIPETTKNVIRFREKYPFLIEQDCPNELKIMVSDMFAAYDKYKEAYTQFSETNTQDENLRIAGEVVENYLNNRAMWDELDYYKENNQLLGNHPVFEQLKKREELKSIPDIDLPKKLTNCKTNITKSKTAVNNAKTDEERVAAQNRLDNWLSMQADLIAEIELRKK